MKAPLRIVHADVRLGLEGLPAGDRGVFLVLWSGARALGHLWIDREELPLQRTDLAQRAAAAVAAAVGERFFPVGFRAPLPDDRRAPSATSRAVDLDVLTSFTEPLRRLAGLDGARRCGERPPGVSVVVCTRDRAQSLKRCLTSLVASSPAADEILVVDNAPATDDARDVVRAFSGIRYVREPRPGLDRARNTGIEQSTREVIAFADDDVEVHERWIAGWREAFRDRAVAAATGLVLPAELETEAQLVFERRWGFNRGYRPRLFDAAWLARARGRGAAVDRIGAGANMAFRREAFAAVGGFDERLDVGAAGCSGDTELWYRLLAAGFSCRYEPSAIVFHHHRRTLTELRRQIFFYMRGHAAALLAQYERHGHTGNLRRLLVSLPAGYVESFARSIVRPETRLTLRAEIAGHCAGIAYYLAHRGVGTVLRPAVARSTT